MPNKYLSDKITDIDLFSAALENIIQGSVINCSTKNTDFKAHANGIFSDKFFIGNLNLNNIEDINVKDSNYCLITLPKNGQYSTKTTSKKTINTSGRTGTLALPTDKLFYKASSDFISDFAIYINMDSIKYTLEHTYNIHKLNNEIFELSLKNDKVISIYKYIETTLNMVENYPNIKKSTFFSKNIQEVTNILVCELIADILNVQPVHSNNPDVNLVRKAEEFIDSNCESLFTIHEIANNLLTSPRKLQIAFKKNRNYTPIQFLRVRKIHRVQKLILSKSRQNITVKEAAFAVGVFDLNRFGKSYFSIFGEYPSDTINNSLR